MDESRRYRLVIFGTLEEGLRAARRIVDDYLSSAHEPGMIAAQLHGSSKMFGEDPFIRTSDPAAGSFSTWTYAGERCDQICAPPVDPQPVDSTTE